MSVLGMMQPCEVQYCLLSALIPGSSRTRKHIAREGGIVNKEARHSQSLIPRKEKKSITYGLDRVSQLVGRQSLDRVTRRNG